MIRLTFPIKRRRVMDFNYVPNLKQFIGNPEYCDTILRFHSGDGVINYYIPRIILISASDYWRTLFAKRFKEIETIEISLDPDSKVTKSFYAIDLIDDTGNVKREHIELLLDIISGSQEHHYSLSEYTSLLVLDSILKLRVLNDIFTLKPPFNVDKYRESKNPVLEEITRIFWQKMIDNEEINSSSVFLFTNFADILGYHELYLECIFRMTHYFVLSTDKAKKLFQYELGDTIFLMSKLDREEVYPYLSYEMLFDILAIYLDIEVEEDYVFKSLKELYELEVLKFLDEWSKDPSDLPSSSGRNRFKSEHVNYKHVNNRQEAFENLVLNFINPSQVVSDYYDPNDPTRVKAMKLPAEFLEGIKQIELEVGHK